MEINIDNGMITTTIKKGANSRIANKGAKKVVIERNVPTMNVTATLTDGRSKIEIINNENNTEKEVWKKARLSKMRCEEINL